MNRTLPLAMSALLFFLLLPILDTFTYPGSVMYGQYVPLIIRLSELYWKTPILSVALLGAPLLLAALLLLAQRRQFGLVRSAALVVVPFAIAWLFQYFIVVQLDDYLVDFAAKGRAIPWHYVFQLPAIVFFLQVLLIYLGIAAVLWLIISLLRRISFS